MAVRRPAILAADRADMNDRAAAGLLQQGQESLRHHEGAFEIGVQHRVPVGVGDGVEIGGLLMPALLTRMAMGPKARACCAHG